MSRNPPSPPIKSADHARRVDRLIVRYPYQFDKPHNGFDFLPGWMGLIEEACRQVDASLLSDEREKFGWTQIKEKFGELRMYWKVKDHQEDIGYSRRDLHLCARWEAAMLRIAEITSEAEQGSRRIPTQ